MASSRAPVQLFAFLPPDNDADISLAAVDADITGMIAANATTLYSLAAMLPLDAATLRELRAFLVSYCRHRRRAYEALPVTCASPGASELSSLDGAVWGALVTHRLLPAKEYDAPLLLDFITLFTPAAPAPVAAHVEWVLTSSTVPASLASHIQFALRLQLGTLFFDAPRTLCTLSSSLTRMTDSGRVASIPEAGGFLRQLNDAIAYVCDTCFSLAAELQASPRIAFLFMPPANVALADDLLTSQPLAATAPGASRTPVAFMSTLASVYEHLLPFLTALAAHAYDSLGDVLEEDELAGTSRILPPCAVPALQQLQLTCAAQACLTAAYTLLQTCYLNLLSPGAFVPGAGATAGSMRANKPHVANEFINILSKLLTHESCDTVRRAAGAGSTPVMPPRLAHALAEFAKAARVGRGASFYLDLLRNTPLSGAALSTLDALATARVISDAQVHFAQTLLKEAPTAARPRAAAVLPSAERATAASSGAASSAMTSTDAASTVRAASEEAAIAQVAAILPDVSKDHVKQALFLARNDVNAAIERLLTSEPASAVQPALVCAPELDGLDVGEGSSIAANSGAGDTSAVFPELWPSLAHDTSTSSRVSAGSGAWRAGGGASGPVSTRTLARELGGADADMKARILELAQAQDIAFALDHATLQADDEIGAAAITNAAAEYDDDYDDAFDELNDVDDSGHLEDEGRDSLLSTAWARTGARGKTSSAEDAADMDAAASAARGGSTAALRGRVAARVAAARESVARAGVAPAANKSRGGGATGRPASSAPHISSAVGVTSAGRGHGSGRGGAGAGRGGGGRVFAGAGDATTSATVPSPRGASSIPPAPEASDLVTGHGLRAKGGVSERDAEYRRENKARFGNHGRKAGADKKMTRAM